MNMQQNGWWLWIIRAASTAIFALIAIVFPPLTSALAVHLYGAYVKLDGFMLIGLNAAGAGKRVWLFTAGVLALITGVTIVLWPLADTANLAFTLAVLGIARGALEAVSAFVSDARSWERVLRFACATTIISFSLMLSAHNAFGLALLVTGFALHATMAAVCQVGAGVEQRARHARTELVLRTNEAEQTSITGLPA